MIGTYIKNSGMSRTFVKNGKSRGNYIKETKWDADYDGDNANIDVYTNDNGKEENYDIKLNNNDLEEILKTPSTKGLIHQRLLTDFNPKSKKKMLSIEYPNEKTETTNEVNIKSLLNTITSSDNLIPLARGLKKKTLKKTFKKKCRSRNGKYKKCTYKKKI